VLDGQVVFPVVGQGFVELAVFLLGDVVGVARPNGLGFVQLLVFGVLDLEIEEIVRLEPG
jgi:hypothetical protein